MQRPEDDRYLMTQSELESRIQVLLAGTIAEEMIFNDVSTGAQNDLERASDIARSMVMEFGMSRLGRVNYPRKQSLAVLAGGGADAGLPSCTASRPPAKSTRKCSASSTNHGKGPPHSRSPQGVARSLDERLIEKEVIDGEELKQIVEETSPGPLVPGTDADRKR